MLPFGAAAGRYGQMVQVADDYPKALPEGGARMVEDDEDDGGGEQGAH